MFNVVNIMPRLKRSGTRGPEDSTAGSTTIYWVVYMMRQHDHAISHDDSHAREALDNSPVKSPPAYI
jgi:hypothetical protein